MNNLHGIIFAYGETPDLRELSQPRNSCSLPYGGRFRLIDFSLSSLVNAGVTDVGIIVHSSYQSLLDHVRTGTWPGSGADSASCPPSAMPPRTARASTGAAWTPWPGSTPI